MSAVKPCPCQSLPLLWAGEWRIGKAAGRMTLADDRHRAGRYLRQPGAYRAFMPAPLSPDPPIRLAGELPQPA